MPTTYNDQFWIIDPFSPPPSGTSLEVQNYELIDQDDDGDIGRAGGDSIDGVDVTRAYPGDQVTVELSDGSQITVTGTTLYLADGREIFTPTDGTVLEDATLVSTDWAPGSGSLDVSQLGPPCLVSGTRVATPDGDMPVEALQAGMQVLAADGRILVLRGVLSTRISQSRLAKDPKLLPIRIVAGALGAGKPENDLLVSRQHRMLLRSGVAQRMFGQNEVLVSSAKLLALPGVFVDTSLKEVTYFHLIFDEHEIILAEGAETESLLVGPGLIESMEKEVVAEVIALFPDLTSQFKAQRPARVIPSQLRAKKLLTRHAKNGRSVTGDGHVV